VVSSSTETGQLDLGLRGRPNGFRADPFGKPDLRGETSLSFSTSHCRSLAVVAVAHGQPVGVDVEDVKPVESDVRRGSCADWYAQWCSVRDRQQNKNGSSARVPGGRAPQCQQTHLPHQEGKLRLKHEPHQEQSFQARWRQAKSVEKSRPLLSAVVRAPHLCALSRVLDPHQFQLAKFVG
jgi:hypothetical protein